MPNSVTSTPFLLTLSLLRSMHSEVLTRCPLPEKNLKAVPIAIAIAKSEPAQISVASGPIGKGYLICFSEIGVLRFFTLALA